MKVSFFILTYNRPEETIEALENIIHFLHHPEFVEIEIIIVNNNSSIDYTILENYIHKPKDICIKYVINEDNKGVAGGRNQAMALCSGDILISLDDDAEFRESDIIVNTIDLFNSHQYKSVGLITYKVVEQSDGRVDIATKNKDNLNKKEFYTTYFKGGAHAIKKDVFKKLGGYEIGGIYGAEEYDLSYRLLDNGYKILHTSDISILHKKSPTGRENYSVQLGYLLQNKSLLAHKYLTRKYFISHLILWSLHYLMKTQGNLLGLIRFLRSTIQLSKITSKTPISIETMEYIKSVGGRLIY